MNFHLMQYRFFRKRRKGKYYKVFPLWLGIAPFWSDKLITSCGTYLLETEEYE